MKDKLSIEILGLSKSYGPKTAVEHLDLTIAPGLIFGFLGPNGAGKTTTIKTIMGLKNASAGDILINGVSIHSPEIHRQRRRIGYLPEEPILYPYLTGREFLHFVAELYEIPGDLGRLVDGWLAQFDLLADADKLIDSYSMGMKKKIAILATLIHEPDILIYDEPTGGLDAPTARRVKQIMADYREAGRIVFFTTHVMEIAERFADRLAIISEGRLRFQGRLESLRAEWGKRDDSLEELFLKVIENAESPRSARVTRMVLP